MYLFNFPAPLFLLNAIDAMHCNEVPNSGLDLLDPLCKDKFLFCNNDNNVDDNDDGGDYGDNL